MHVVRQLRDFGFSAKKIKLLMDQLLNPGFTEEIVKSLLNSSKEFQNLQKRFSGIDVESLRPQLEKLIREDTSYKEMKASQLTGLVLNCMLQRQRINLHITPDGECLPYLYHKKEFYEENEKLWRFIHSSHISISLNDIISYYLPKDYISSVLTAAVFSENELKLIETVRDKKVLSVVVSFDKDHEIDLIESEYNPYLDLSQRLCEIILKNEYQDINIKIAGGKIVHCTRKVKRKTK